MQNNILQQVKSVGGHDPEQISGSSDIDSSYVDRLGFRYGSVAIQTGAVTGTPDAVTAAVKLLHCDTTGGSYTVFATFETVLDIKTAVLRKTYPVDLSGAKRYLEVRVTPTFTAGTSPKVFWSSQILLGDGDIEPTNNVAVSP